MPLLAKGIKKRVSYLDEETLGDKLVGAFVWLLQFAVMLAILSIPVLLALLLGHFIVKYW
jgi:hypothetical protein